MKTILTLMATCICLGAGGVAILFINGDNVMSAEMWRIAFRGVLSSPGVILGEAFGGRDTAFFGGIFVAVAGAIAAVAFAALAAAFGSLMTLASFMRGLAARRGERESGPDEKVAKPASGKVGKSGAGLRRSLSAAIASVRRTLAGISLPDLAGRKVFVDRDANLEEDTPAEKRESLFSRLKGAMARRKARPDEIVISSAGTEDVVVEIEDESAFAERLQQWYSRIKSADKNDPDCVTEARKLQKKASKRARDAVIEQDAMNGVFMLRMMDAWASKGDGGDSPEQHAPATVETTGKPEEEDVFSRAISDVMEAGLESDDGSSDFDMGDIDDDGDDFILDDVGGDFSFGEDAYDGPEAGSEQPDEQDATATDEAEGSSSGEPETGGEFVIEGDDGGGIDEQENAETAAVGLRSIEVASMICDLEEKAARVAAFDDEWEDDMVDPEIRERQVDEMFDALDAAYPAEAQEISSMSSFDADGDQREIEWLQANGGDLEEKRRSLKLAVGGASDGDPGEDDADLEDAFGISGGIGSQDGSFEDGAEQDRSTDADQDPETEAAEDHAEFLWLRRMAGMMRAQSKRRPRSRGAWRRRRRACLLAETRLPGSPATSRYPTWRKLNGAARSSSNTV